MTASSDNNAPLAAIRRLRERGDFRFSGLSPNIPDYCTRETRIGSCGARFSHVYSRFSCSCKIRRKREAAYLFLLECDFQYWVLSLGRPFSFSLVFQIFTALSPVPSLPLSSSSEVGSLPRCAKRWCIQEQDTWSLFKFSAFPQNFLFFFLYHR